MCVGDVFRIGKATVQVSQPRMPCAKLAGKNKSKVLPKLMANTGYTGFYSGLLKDRSSSKPGFRSQASGFRVCR